MDEIEYVDYLTEFKLYSYTPDDDSLIDSNEVEALTPHAILVSVPKLVITESITG